MRFKSFFLASFMMALTGYAVAEQVVAFVNALPDGNVNSSLRRYLTGNSFRDEGYVDISFKVDNPGAAVCVTPEKDSYFVSKKLDVTLTAQIYGIFGVDSSKEIPLATYSWTGKDGKYCRSAFKDPIQIVPPSPIGVSNGINISLTPANDPTIIVHLRYSSEDTEQVSAYAKSLLGISATLGTGGAATTVVGLTNLAGGPVVKFLSDEFNRVAKNKGDESFTIPMTWQEIASGKAQKKITLSQTELGGWLSGDSVSQAIAELQNHTRPKVKEILTVSFNINTRRSMFSNDENLEGESFIPKISSLLSKSAILNYPRSRGATFKDFPSVFQRVSAETSDVASFNQKLASKDASICDSLLVAVHDLGFNRIDRALVMGAILDDAYPEWRSDPKFYLTCLHLEPNIQEVLTKQFPDKLFAYGPPYIVSAELALNLPQSYWRQDIEAYLQTLRLAMYSSPTQREEKLNMLLGNVPIMVDPTLATTSIPVAPATSISGVKQLSGATVKKAGCMFGYLDQYSKGYAAFVFTAINTIGKVDPYLLIADLPEKSQGNLVPKNVWIYNLNVKSGELGFDEVKALGTGKFGSNSMCRSADESGKQRTFDQMLLDLVK
ncbi:hypothetical protein ACO0K0_19360 [Undibacterium sp. SXout11W]|uniref:hypothetical protein n=1 Tax=Undibacterium sp. SXout11W TaxID=3413050 RepID=UPI003BF19424